MIAEDWFRQFQGVTEAQTLGWLLGKRPDKAADHVWRKYPDGMAYPRPDQGWIYRVFDDACQGMQHDSTIANALAIGALLEQSVKDAERILDNGLRTIQERYEGGEPFV